MIEFLEKKNLYIPIQIFASDLDANAVEKARSGIYPVSAVQGVSVNYLKQYFKKIESHYQIAKSVREICVFSQHNLLKDPPFSRMDFISCQNVLIYLETAPQKKILQTFHYALKHNGYLFLGKSESIGALSDIFESFDKKIKLYSRKPTKSPQLEFTIHAPVNILPKETRPAEQHADGDVAKDMDKLMLSRFVHPGVVVDRNMVIIQFFGLTSPYLAPVTGKASFNVLKMIREDLVIDLRSLLQQARKTEKVAIKEGIRIYNKKMPLEITLEVVPQKTAGKIFYLVVFKENAVMLHQKQNGIKSKASVDQKERTIQKLKQELVQSIEVIRTTSEEYETTYEELQANNEEILSSNEELQSVNESVQMNQLFHNLLSNALKFGKKDLIINIGSREITEEDFSKYEELKREKHYVCISVQDNGIGFDQTYVAKIFTLFQRLNDKKDVEGTGIGLALCKKIVELHGGFIGATGMVNVGATFSVFLPTDNMGNLMGIVCGP